jgi:ribosomal protein L34E
MQTKRWKDAKKLAKNLKKALTSCATCAIIHSVKGRYKKNPGQKEVMNMAKAIATYKCPDCGATVERRIDGFNRRDANSKKEWAEAHPLLCADCYRKQQREAAAALSLPTIHGVSEKQVEYATDLRAKFVAQHEKTVADAIATRDDPDKQAAIAAAAEKAGMTIEEFIRQNLDKFPYKWLYAAYVVSTATEARDIIDTLTAR